MNVIDLQSLRKEFGAVTAVDGISFQVAKGEMFGLVGPDGAGKTTAIRVMCGLISPGSGTVSILSADITKQRKKIQNSIGYLSQKFSLYGDLSVDENIAFFAEIHNVRDYEARREELLDFVRMKPFRDRLADRLSGGMKQKLALACSLIHTPEILFLDEPTTGVDPVSRRDFWKILSDLQQRGITIFMATPYLDEAERCTRVALMHEGKILDIDEPGNLKGKTGLRVIEVLVKDVRTAAEKLKTIFPYDIQLFGDRINILLDEKDSEDTGRKIEEVLSGSGIRVESQRIIAPSLENVFIHSIAYNRGKESPFEGRKGDLN